MPLYLVCCRHLAAKFPLMKYQCNTTALEVDLLIRNTNTITFLMELTDINHFRYAKFFNSKCVTTSFKPIRCPSAGNDSSDARKRCFRQHNFAFVSKHCFRKVYITHAHIDWEQGPKLQIVRWLYQFVITPKRKYRHIDENVVPGCNQWLNIRQHHNSSVSVLRDLPIYLKSYVPERQYRSYH